jgi:hypothetical protein
LAGTQLSPAAQVTQTPPLHTLPVPHDVPFATLPESRQTGEPVLQVVMPLRQGLPGTVQLAPPVQAVQAPGALHTMLVPHDVPAAMLVAASLHCTVAPQASAPLWHGLLGVQVPPAMQVLQTPA